MNKIQSFRSTAYRLTLDAMFVAINVAFGMLPSEISWQSLPVLLCAFLMRPGDAIAVSLLGSFIEQMRYGLNFMSLFWMLPWALFGLVAGFGAMWCRKNPKFFSQLFKSIVLIVACELLLNFSNTAVLLYLGYLVMDASSLWLVLGGFLLRTPLALIRAVLSSVTVPLLLPPLRKQLEGVVYTRSPK